jgi:hypothetical protein
MSRPLGFRSLQRWAREPIHCTPSPYRDATVFRPAQTYLLRTCVAALCRSCIRSAERRRVRDGTWGDHRRDRRGAHRFRGLGRSVGGVGRTMRAVCWSRTVTPPGTDAAEFVSGRRTCWHRSADGYGRRRSHCVRRGDGMRGGKLRVRALILIVASMTVAAAGCGSSSKLPGRRRHRQRCQTRARRHRRLGRRPRRSRVRTPERALPRSVTWSATTSLHSTPSATSRQ